MKLSWSQTKSYTGWRKYIGKDANGQPRCFYFGRDRADAELKASKLILAWKRLVASGAVGWTDEAVRAALNDCPAPPQSPPAPIPAPPVNPVAQPAPRMVQNNLTLHKAIDEYLEYETRRAPSQVSYAHLYGVRSRVDRMKRAMADCPLAFIGYDELAQTVAHFASRPSVPIPTRRSP
ncbi:MAG: hypothetical protein ACM359_20345 [Bacillota bacterium]